jgi:hypothetical protein
MSLVSGVVLHFLDFIIFLREEYMKERSGSKKEVMVECKKIRRNSVRQIMTRKKRYNISLDRESMTRTHPFCLEFQSRSLLPSTSAGTGPWGLRVRTG